MVAKIVVILEYFHMEVLLGVGKTNALIVIYVKGALVEVGGGNFFSCLQSSHLYHS